MSESPPDDDTGSRSQTQRISIELVNRAGQARRPSVVVIDGRSLGAMFELSPEPVTIGRDPDNHLVIDEVGVSRQHAVVWLAEGKAVVRDTDSKNGTYVNGRPIQQLLLEDGDLMFIGQTTLKYLAADNVEQAYYEYLHQITVEDPLTGIPNRRYFDEFVIREVARTARYRRPLALLMIDVDRFKSINDTYGHLCGDTVLRELAQLISRRLRRSEFIARYGGEEFALVLPETDSAGARIIAERIRQTVEDHEFYCGELRLPVTVSVGGAVWRPDMVEPRDLIAEADANLYDAKDQGRNKVVL